MKIAHVAIYTRDLKRLCQFYCRWFGGKAGSECDDAAKSASSCFLRFGSGAELELMNRQELGETVRREFAAGFTHLAFEAETKSKVEALTAQMRENGVPVINAPRETEDGRFESCILDPDGNRVEIVAQRA